MNFSKAILAAGVIVVVLILAVPAYRSKKSSRDMDETSSVQDMDTEADSNESPAGTDEPEQTSPEQLKIDYYNDLVRRFGEIRESVSDPLADEGSVRRDLQELIDLREEVADLVGPDVELRQETDPVRKFVNLFDLTLRDVQKRIPGDIQVEAPIRTGFPVPDFPDNETLEARATKLRVAQQTLARQLQNESDSDAEATKALVLELSQALEDLGWEAGWPFTESEADAHREAGKLTQDVYASRLKRGMERIREKVSFERSSVGRGAPPATFTLYRPQEDTPGYSFIAYLKETRGVDAVPGFVVPFDEAARETLLGNREP